MLAGSITEWSGEGWIRVERFSGFSLYDNYLVLLAECDTVIFCKQERKNGAMNKEEATFSEVPVSCERSK